MSDADSTHRLAPTAIEVSGPVSELRLFLVAGEHSGDALGAKLMAAINARQRGRVRYLGVGGELMEREGLISQFPLSDVAVMGPLAIAMRLPRLVSRVYQTVDAAVAADPDAVVIIDAPEFTQPIAKRIRKRRPKLPIVNYVSPSVWAWRPGRAKRMRAWVDHIMALLPFEPDAHVRLGGPRCTYVGHPLIERYDEIRTADPVSLSTKLGLARDKPVLVVLPGSRRSEVERLMGPFGKAIQRLDEKGVQTEILIPTVDHVRALVETKLAEWPVKAHVLAGEADKFRAFRLASAALAASGTVTLELALAGTPMVVGYRVDILAAQLQFLVKTPHFALSNLILGERAFPELMQEHCTPETLAAALAEVMAPGPVREKQLAALARVPAIMRQRAGLPSEAAAEIVLAEAQRPRRR